MWWLLREPGSSARRRGAIFISNERQQVVLFEQCHAPPGVPVLWDYHVIALFDDEVWDLDSRLPLGVALDDYLAATFPTIAGLESFAPLFRVVSAEELETTFATDRSHMLSPDGVFLRPPPPWEPPGRVTMSLPRYLDMSDRIAGTVVDLEGLRRVHSR